MRERLVFFQAICVAWALAGCERRDPSASLSPSSPIGRALSVLGLAQQDRAGLALEGRDFVYRKPGDPRSGFEARLDAEHAEFELRRPGSKSVLRLRPAQGALSPGRAVRSKGSLVYASTRQDAAVVLTPHPAGVKEDIVLSRPLDDRMIFHWDLDLTELEARLDAQGSVNIYGKGQLLYRIPAPVVAQAGGSAPADSAHYELEGKRLALVANRLRSLSYPISLDPPVLVVTTTTAEFQLNGSDEGILQIGNNQITRDKLQPGAGTWNFTTSFATPRLGHTTVAYNGFLYVIGGCTAANGPCSAYTSDVSFAPINANGTLGAWASTTALPTGRAFHSSVVYDGYLYSFGGANAGSVGLTDALVAKINANGTLGAWTATTALNPGRRLHCATAYQGYVYVLGGINSSNFVINSVHFAPINANGTLGAWTATVNLPTFPYLHSCLAYNNVLYQIAGVDGSSGNDTFEERVSRINANGTLNGFVLTAILPVTRSGHVSVQQGGSLYNLGGNLPVGGDRVVTNALLATGILGFRTITTPFSKTRVLLGGAAYNGFLYVTGGGNNNAGTILYNDVEYAPLVVGAPPGGTGQANLQALTPAARSNFAVVGGEQDFLYILGGQTSGGPQSDVWYANQQFMNGSVNTWNAGPSFSVPRSKHTAVISNRRIYVAGGNDGSGFRNDVQMAPLNANGSVGAWSAATSFPSGREEHTMVTFNNFIYILGGRDGAGLRNDVQMAPVDPTSGAVGPWSATTSFPTAREKHVSFAYNGNLYVIGGSDGTNRLGDVMKAAINADGTLGAWTSTNALPSGREDMTGVAIEGYVYLLGGRDGTGATVGSIVYAPINDDGTVGGWTTNAVSFATARRGHGGAVNRGYLYAFSGLDSGSALIGDLSWLTTVTPGPIGQYSKVLDLGLATSAIDTFTWNGAANQGTVRLQYRVAPPSGVFGSIIDKGPVTRGAPLTLDANTGMQFIWVRLSLDDTYSLTSNASAPNARDVSDFTIGYNGCTGVTCTALDSCHDVGVCNPATGLCSNPLKADGSSCTDGNPCTTGETCTAGVCSGSSPAGVLWCFDSLAASLGAPAINPGVAVYMGNNNGDVVGLDINTSNGVTDGTRLAGWADFTSPIGPIDGRLGVGSTVGTLYVGSEDGCFYSASAATGAAGWWSGAGTFAGGTIPCDAAAERLADMIVANPARSVSTLYVATRNTTGATPPASNTAFGDTQNMIWALDRASGASQWTFNLTGTQNVGIISNTPTLDQAHNCLYFTSRQVNPTHSTVWAIRTAVDGCLGAGAAGSMAWSTDPTTDGADGNIDAAPGLSTNNCTLYVGTNAGRLYALNTGVAGCAGVAGSNKWTGAGYFDTAVTAIFAESIWVAGTNLYFSLNTGSVMSVMDPGAGVAPPAAALWTRPVASPAFPLVMNFFGQAYVGSSDGKIHQINLSNGTELTQTITFGAPPPTLGSPTLDTTSCNGSPQKCTLFIPSTAGTLYAVRVPF